MLKPILKKLFRFFMCLSFLITKELFYFFVIANFAGILDSALKIEMTVMQICNAGVSKSYQYKFGTQFIMDLQIVSAQTILQIYKVFNF